MASLHLEAALAVLSGKWWCGLHVLCCIIQKITFAVLQLVSNFQWDSIKAQTDYFHGPGEP